jgi:hypothetical protein
MEGMLEKNVMHGELVVVHGLQASWCTRVDRGARGTKGRGNLEK